MDDGIFKGDNNVSMKTYNVDLFNYSLKSLIEIRYEITYKTYDLDCLNTDNIMRNTKIKLIIMELK